MNRFLPNDLLQVEKQGADVISQFKDCAYFDEILLYINHVVIQTGISHRTSFDMSQ